MHANAELDCNRSAFFDLLCRPSIDRSKAALLITNIQVDADESQLHESKKRLLDRTRMLINEVAFETQPPTEWLRWALEHKELLLGCERDKDRITQVLLAFDRHRDRNATMLRELEAKLLADQAKPEKPLHPSERKSTEQIIAALAEMAKLDLSSPYKADGVLREAAAKSKYALELPDSPETTVKFLKAAAARARIS